MKRNTPLLIAALLVIFCLAAAQSKIDPQELTLEKLFRVKPYQGTTARVIDFSKDSRYLAYLWNPFGERGTDLYIYDLKTGKTQRVTSLEIMKQFDPPEDYQKFVDKDAQKKQEDELLQKMYDAENDFLAGKNVDLSVFEKQQIEELKKETEKRKQEEEAKKKEEGKKQEDTKKQEEVKKATATQQQEAEKKDTGKEKQEESGKAEKVDKKGEAKKDEVKEEWEWRDELKKKKEKEKVKPEDLYPGVSRFVWARSAPEMVFEYRGDLYRYLPVSNKIERLTMTEVRESIIDYADDGKSYFYRVEAKVFQGMFDSPRLVQINHEPIPEYKYTGKEKEDKYKINNTSVSPNGKWMVVTTVKSEDKPSEKEVQIMSYKKRFAEATKVRRETPDDPLNTPEGRFYVYQVSTNAWGKEPEPVFTTPGGNVFYQFRGLNWSKDSSKYTFYTWEQAEGKHKIYLGKAAEGEKPELIYENKEPIGRETGWSINPEFIPDGKKMIVILDETGFRQPYVIDLETKAITQVIKGDFESFPVVGFTPDSKYFFVISDKEGPATKSVYKVNIATGEMVQVGKSGGMHRSTSVSEDGRWIATVFGNWANRPELYLVPADGKTEKILTSSHDPEWDKINLIQPELFTFKNRHGDTISGMMFKPPGWKPTDQRPGIVYVYGGPLGSTHTVEMDTFNTSCYHFQMYMAAKHGYVGVSIDPRGQSGYGRKFAESNYEQVGRPQVEDLEDLVKFMQSGFGVDNLRLGLYGWSFGGFQTQMMLYTSPDTFACGIAGAGPTEWENYNTWYTGNTIATPVKGKTVMRKYSLLPLAKNLKKPLLLVHGMEDDNVLFQDTVNVYKSLLEAGKEALVELFLDPEGKHGMGAYVSRKAQFKKYEEFFQRHLGNATP